MVDQPPQQDRRPWPPHERDRERDRRDDEDDVPERPPTEPEPPPVEEPRTPGQRGPYVVEPEAEPIVRQPGHYVAGAEGTQDIDIPQTEQPTSPSSQTRER